MSTTRELGSLVWRRPLELAAADVLIVILQVLVPVHFADQDFLLGSLQRLQIDIMKYVRLLLPIRLRRAAAPKAARIRLGRLLRHIRGILNIRLVLIETRIGVLR